MFLLIQTLINWLVTWVVVSCFCVFGDPVLDEFGRIRQASFPVCHDKCVSEVNEKYFKDECEALRFMVRGEQEEDLRDFNIKPVYK